MAELIIIIALFYVIGLQGMLLLGLTLLISCFIIAAFN